MRVKSFPFPKGNHLVFLFFTFLTPLTFLLSGPAKASPISEAVVKIYTVANAPSYHAPWQLKGQTASNGSGFIIKGNVIMTNAHVVANDMFIQVRRAGQANKYHAVVQSIDFESDLAILSVEKKEFFNGAKPLRFGNLAEIRDKVAVYGFPDGGDKLSITEGVVSRIDFVEYAYSGAFMLTCQIDAPVNSGNSGGPVIFNNKVVGVAFQGMGGDYENIGYMIPVPVIRHFLDDITDGKVDGFPTLGILMQKLENPDMRRFYHLDGLDNGVLVNKIYVHSPVHGILFPGDVLLKVDGVPVASDGTISFRKGQRTYFGYLLHKKQIGSSVHLSLLREGMRQSVDIRLTVPQEANRLVPYEHDKKPRYAIYGGLVFEPLTLNYLQEYGDGYNWMPFAPVAMVNYALNGEKDDQQEEVVILSKVLADKSNVGFHDFSDVIIKEVNGRGIHSFPQFIKTLEENRDEFITLKTESFLEITLAGKTIEKSMSRILKKYQVSRQCWRGSTK